MIVIFDGNNVLHRFIYSSPMPAQSFVERVRNLPQNIAPVVAWDGPYAKAYRQKICPEYKSKREPSGDSFYEYADMLKDALRHVRCIQSTIDEHEGDDIIASVCIHNVGNVKWIDSTDRDLQRLGVLMTAYPDETVDPQFELTRKTLVGDNSDNIPGLRGFGPKAWDKLSREDKLKIYIWLAGAVTISVSDDKLKSKLVTNKKTLLSYYKVMSFRPIRKDVLQKSFTIGTNNPKKCQAILGEFSL